MVVLVMPADVSSSFMTLQAVSGQAYAGTSMRRSVQRWSACDPSPASTSPINTPNWDVTRDEPPESHSDQFESVQEA